MVRRKLNAYFFYIMRYFCREQDMQNNKIIYAFLSLSIYYIKSCIAKIAQLLRIFPLDNISINVNSRQVVEISAVLIAKSHRLMHAVIRHFVITVALRKC